MGVGTGTRELARGHGSWHGDTGVGTGTRELARGHGVLFPNFGDELHQS